MKQAQIVSYLFHPLWAPTLGMYLVIQSHPYFSLAFTPEILWRFLGFVFTFTALIPGGMVWWLVRNGTVSSLHLPLRQERRLPLLFGLFSFVAAFYILKRAYLPELLEGVMWAGIICLTACYLINWRLKLSIHMAAWGGLAGQVFFLGPFRFEGAFEILALLVIAAGVVAAARLKLSAHQPKEIFVGWLVGFFSGSVLYWIA